MGKKTKVGKERRDVFYFRAKEAGYRSRAAYKLIQLNKKYNFLSSSRVCIDLCAAPGSWMQVCTKFMPVSSVIVGVDLYPIHQIPNTIGIQGDITTEKVRRDLKANLKTWKADVVLHDGAPNVGQSWLHDAYHQNLLVLHAFKLSCEFLRKGGTFVTKVFRSKDHLSLEYVFRKLFKKVEATKPIASRYASAEMFVVCQGFLSPDKIDSQFFDPKSVFQLLESEPKNQINIFKPEKRAKAEGYEEGVTMLYKKTKISIFLTCANFVELLEETNEFEWDSKFAMDSDLTTTEIVHFAKDIKVLGRKDLRKLLNWRKNVSKEMEDLKNEQSSETIVESIKEPEPDKDDVDIELEEISEVQKQIQELKATQAQEEKQRRKRTEKKLKRLKEKQKLRLMVPGDAGPQDDCSGELFKIKSLDKAVNVDSIIDQEADISLDEDYGLPAKLPRTLQYTKGSTILDAKGHSHLLPNESEDDDEASELDSSDDEGLALDDVSPDNNGKERKHVTFALDDDKGDSDDGDNPITTDLVGDLKVDRRERKAEKWYSSSDFEEVEDDTLEDYELESAISAHRATGGKLMERKDKSAFDSETGYSSEGSDEGESSVPKVYNKVAEPGPVEDCPKSDSEKGSDSDSELEDEKVERTVRRLKRKKPTKLTPEGLALATKMIQSRKQKRDIINDSWNRYMRGDEELPDFFAESEKKFNCPQMNVDKEDLRMYRDENKGVDVKTIKKAVEAKARKARRARKMFAKARKKATEITNSGDMTSREKSLELKKIYKKATKVLKPKEKKYVIMKKSFGGQKPKGVKGPYKLVDRRLKKDKRGLTAKEKKKGKR